MLHRIPEKYIWFVPILLFLLGVLSTSVVPINSNDFFWHLKTGEYILQTNSIPSEDPFTFTSGTSDESEMHRKQLILSGYWASQVLYALIEGQFGLEGIILLRGLLYVLLGIVVVLLIRNERGSFIPFILFVLAMRISLEDSDRPQLFSYLFAASVVFIVEWSVRVKSKKLPYLTVPLLLVASNMHGGFVIAGMFLVIYLACLPFEDRFKPVRQSLLVSGLSSLAVTYCNPNHWDAVVHTFALAQSKSSAVYSTITEYQSPFGILQYTYTNAGWMSYWGLVLLAIFSFMYCLYKKRYSWCILLLGTLAASLYVIRLAFFFVPVATFVTAVMLGEVLSKKIRNRSLFESVLVSALLLILIVKPGHANSYTIRYTLWETLYPRKAAEYMARENLPGEVFNLFTWGGYLEWRLWPKYRMFVDTRELVNSVYEDYLRVAGNAAECDMILERYGIKTIIFSAIDPYTGKMYPLVRELSRSESWSLIYYDGTALIFVKKGYYPSEIAKNNVYYEVLSELQSWQSNFPWSSEEYERSRREALTQLGLL